MNGIKTRERPLLFSSAMVNAILRGEKTQTRRIIKPQPPDYINELHGGELSKRAPYAVECNETGNHIGHGFVDDDEVFYKCKHGRVGDQLWVREAWTHWAPKSDAPLILYRADESSWHRLGDVFPFKNRTPNVWLESDFNPLKESIDYKPKWKPSIHMLRKDSRITLEITDVRVERLNDISEADAKAEGVMPSYAHTCADLGHPHDSRRLFEKLWNSINGPGSWDASPWVWAIAFKKVAP